MVVLPFCKVLCRSTVEGCGAFVQMPHVCARQSSERHSGRCISSLLWVTPCRCAMERCAAPPIAGLLSLAPQQCCTVLYLQGHFGNLKLLSRLVHLNSVLARFSCVSTLMLNFASFMPETYIIKK